MFEGAEKPFCSVLIPVRNKALYIERCLRSLLVNDYPRERFEILVLDVESIDTTCDIVMRMAYKDPRVQLLNNPKRLQTYAMNLGIREARGKVIIRVDGHVEVSSDSISRSVAELEAHRECACVGGSTESVHKNEVAEAVSLAMSSPFGVGNALLRLGNYEGYVDTLAFGAYRKTALKEVGLFDTRLARNEDDELHYRLLKAGYKIWLSSKIRSRYCVRASLPKLFRQYFQYGYWKVYVNREHRTLTSLRQLAPSIMMIGFTLLGVAALVWLPAQFALAALAMIYSGLALGAALKKTTSICPCVKCLAS